MPFREKITWVSALTMALVYGWYFWTVLPLLRAGQASVLHFGLLLQGTIIALVVLQVSFIVAVAALAPRDAQASEDEREKLIALKGTRAAYFVLVAGALLASVGGIFFHTGSVLLGNAILLAVVAANLVKDVTQIVHYRLGA
jgi:hypothetical protein